MWFKKTNDAGDLQMKPPFQRNPVWTWPQKSYLIDSILNGYPVPEIYMQEFVDEDGNEQHIIIDGQQRIRSCLDFIEGKFSIKEDESPTWGGMSFDDLSGEDKKKIFGYIFIARILPEMSDDAIRGIFQRLNKNVVALNKQELRQATYWGPFISTMQELSNYSYWSTTGIFTPLNIRRMMDVEFISELAIAVIHGHQNKKETIDRYYQEYEEEFEQRDELTSIFRTVIYELEQLLPDIKNTRWKKKTDFYSLFIYLSSNYNRLPLTQEKRALFREVLDGFSADVNSYISSGEEDEAFKPQVASYGRSIRASSDLGNRKRRHSALCELFDPILDIATQDAPVSKMTPLQKGLFEQEDQAEDES
ncbi:DUF262 domain-containing protein [Aeromonas piscicola]|uniref:DUF262 domain-containing protein n=1 Tax=Aeromonas piscicola TaxID=600645 RepID=A0ABT7QG01_9GAMM|nr:DUF262 domain-containing protein [Aeromonas piscicola]MDM5132895.1 DUF262 domain-containing protein [Aeromonas piscicola]